jgi:hypothetical protein
MKPRYSTAYLNRLFSSDAYQDLSQLSSILCATDRFSQGESDYGLPQPLFVFVECLHWLAMSWRSGSACTKAWTPWQPQSWPVATQKEWSIGAIRKRGALSTFG